MDGKDSVFRSLEIIESRISEKLTIKNIADGVYFSKYHYQRLFREIVGDSVMEYVSKRKLTLAGRELLETDANILEIASKYGFDSHEGFTRSFKSYMGVTPSDYRRFNLTAISQKTVKGRYVMTYTKTTDEIIRELNGFIAKAKETASVARKGSGVPEYLTFWQMVAEKTDAFADEANDILNRITAISEHPDEISNRFSIIKVIENIAFMSNLLAFNVGLTVSRDTPERTKMQEALYAKYLELAKSATLKAEKIVGFFNELSSLIFNNMKKSAADKISEVIQKGNAAISGIEGYSNIRFETANIVSALAATPIEKVSVSALEEYMFRLSILSLAADIDVLRSPEDKSFFDGLAAFVKSMSDAVEFFQSLVMPESNPVLECTIPKRLDDIAYQGNILLFYTRAEISPDKLGRYLSEEQTASLGKICDMIDSFISFTQNAVDETAFSKVADMLCKIKSAMTDQADKLGEHGSAIKFLANEFGGLANAVSRI